MPKGEQVELPTPGTNQKKYLAGALDIRTGQITHCVWARKTGGLFLELLEALDTLSPPRRFSRLSLVVDNAKGHHARAVTDWLVTHPRVELLFLPASCPQANPIERAFGDVHDKGTRNHKRKRLCDLVTDVQVHFLLNAPWRYHLADLYYTPEVTAARQSLADVQAAPLAA
jgi:transposase